MTDLEQAIYAHLMEARDLKYRDFHRALIPNLPPESILGVRTPQLRAMAKQLAKRPEAERFLASLPHRYYEENNLHAYLINTLQDYGRAIGELERFLPYVDNWATCDALSPAAFRRRPPALLEQCVRWLDSPHPYTVRFGIGVLMQHYLGEAFSPAYLEWVAAVRSDEYYVNMMVAWYFATALAKQYDAALPYLTGRRLDRWTHNKTIQKALESYRVTPEHKQVLRRLKVK